MVDIGWLYLGIYKRAVVGPIELSFWNDKFM